MPAAARTGASGSASSTVSPADPKNASDGTCSGGHGGQRTRRPAGALEQMPNDTRSRRRRRRRASRRGGPAAVAAAWPPSRPPSATAVTSSAAPIAPSRRRPIGGSSTCIASPNDRRRGTAAAVPTTSRRPRSPRRACGGDESDHHDRDEADQHPQPGARRAVRPRIAAGRDRPRSPASAVDAAADTTATKASTSSARDLTWSSSSLSTSPSTMPTWRPLEVFHHHGAGRGDVTSRRGGACCTCHAGGRTPGVLARRRRARSRRARHAAPRPPAFDRRSAAVSDAARTADRWSGLAPGARDRGRVGDRPQPVQPVVALRDGVGGRRPRCCASGRSSRAPRGPGCTPSSSTRATSRGSGAAVTAPVLVDGDLVVTDIGVRRPDRARPGDRRRTVASAPPLPRTHDRSPTSSSGAVHRSSME